MNDWQSSLQNFLNDNPDLPQGIDNVEKSEDIKPAKKPKLSIAFERKGRAGKSATIIHGFPEDFPDDEIAALAAMLKQKLATGGSARGGEILIQGDRRDDVKRLLQAEGFKV